MGRSARVDFPGGRFHVVNRGVDRGRIFFDDRDRVEFGRLLGEIHERFGVRVLAYCLMDNHYHLVVHCPEGGLSDAMHHLGGTFATHVNERVGRVGHLFGARFFSAPITTDEYLLAAIRYVERNPLDISGVGAAWQYRWSSHRANAGYKVGPEWLDSAAVRSSFSDAVAYRRFIDGNVAADRTLRLDPDLVDTIVGVSIAVHRPDDLTPQRLDRTVKLLLLDRLDEVNCTALTERLGYPSRDALGRARRSARQRLADAPAVGHLVDVTLATVLDAHGAMCQAQSPGRASDAA